MYINLRTVFALVQGITWIHPKKKSFFHLSSSNLAALSEWYIYLVD